MKTYVYILKCTGRGAERLYIGYTTDLERRLAQHESGESGYTSKYEVSLLAHFVVTGRAATVDGKWLERFLKRNRRYGYAIWAFKEGRLPLERYERVIAFFQRRMAKEGITCDLRL